MSNTQEKTRRSQVVQRGPGPASTRGAPKRKPSAPAKRSASGGKKANSTKMSSDRKSSARSSAPKAAKQRKGSRGQARSVKRVRSSSAKSARSTSSRSARSVSASSPGAAAGQVLVQNAAPHTRCAITWTADPQNPRRVVATLTLADDFELDNKDHVGLLVELLRSNASRPTFTFAVWEALRPQILALAPRTANGKKPPAGAYSGFHRIVSTFTSIAKKASHRRRKTGERRRLGFRLAHRVSDAFVAFANANGAEWPVGECRSRAKCNVLLFAHVRIENLREGGRIKVSPDLAPLLDAADPITTDPSGDRYIPSKLLQTLLTRHHGPNLTAFSSCGEPPKDTEDTLPLPPSLMRKGFSGHSSGPAERFSYRQLARVSRAFAVGIGGWDPKKPHSRFVGTAAALSYCREHGLVIPSAPALPQRLQRYRLDDTLRSLFAAAELDVKGDDIGLADIRRLVRKHIDADPKGETDCPPFEDIPTDNDAVPARFSDLVVEVIEKKRKSR